MRTPLHEMCVQMAAAYDEASKIIGLSDEQILALLEKRDHFDRLVTEIEGDLEEPEVPLSDCVEYGSYD